jgi:hypothetical protein
MTRNAAQIVSRTSSSVTINIYSNHNTGPADENAPFSFMVAGPASGTVPPPITNEGAVAQQSSQSIPVSTPTLLNFPALVRDDGDFWSAGDDTRLTVTIAGWYVIGTTMKWSAGSGNPSVELLLNGTTAFPMGIVEPLFITKPEVNGYLAYYCSPGDYFQVRVTQVSSPAVTLVVSSGFFSIASLTATGAIVDNTSTQSISNSTTTALAFQNAIRNDGSSFWSSGANTRLTVPTTGWYLIGFAISWGGVSGANARIAELRLNGTTSFPIISVNALSTVVNTLESGYLQYYCTAGDYFEIAVWQNSGVTLPINTPSYFYINKLT